MLRGASVRSQLIMVPRWQRAITSERSVARVAAAVTAAALEVVVSDGYERLHIDSFNERQ